MVSKISYTCILTSLFVHGAGKAFAQGSTGDIPPGGGSTVNTPDTMLDNPLGDTTSIPALLAQLLDILVMIAVPVAIVFLVYSGFLFVTAQGNQEKLKDAKRALLYTIVGIAVIVGAALIATVIKGTIDQLGGNALSFITHYL